MALEGTVKYECGVLLEGNSGVNFHYLHLRVLAEFFCVRYEGKFPFDERKSNPHTLAKKSTPLSDISESLKNKIKFLEAYYSQGPEQCLQCRTTNRVYDYISVISEII